MADWVLGRPQGADRDAVDGAEARAAQAVEAIIKDGVPSAMNRFN